MLWFGLQCKRLRADSTGFGYKTVNADGTARPHRCWCRFGDSRWSRRPGPRFGRDKLVNELRAVMHTVLLYGIGLVTVQFHTLVVTHQRQVGLAGQIAVTGVIAGFGDQDVFDIQLGQGFAELPVAARRGIK